jgi:hypothetical protein
MDQTPAVYEIPTELQRADVYAQRFVAAGLVLFSYMVRNHLGMTWFWMSLPLPIVGAICLMTSAGAGDLPVIGGLAAGLRSKLGLRGAHEWLAAYWHYFRVRQWPDFQHWSVTTWRYFRLRSAMRMLNCLEKLQHASGVVRASKPLRFWKAS